jgi:hypothetical protein
VSLRSELHMAYDELAPDRYGLPERVVQTVLDDGPSRRYEARWVTRFRAPLALVAVFVVIAIVAGLLAGGRILEDWSAFTHRFTPAGGIDRSVLAQLEARPLHLTTVASFADCPLGPFNYYGDMGSGPVYADYWTSLVTARGRYWHWDFLTEPSLRGPVLIRAMDLLSGQRWVFTGLYAAGGSVGTDKIEGNTVQLYPELAFDTDHPPQARVHSLAVWHAVAGGVAVAGAWCPGIQVDGLGFTEDFV